MLVDEVDVSTTPEVVTQLPGLVLVLLVSWLWKKRRGLMTFYLKLCDGVVCSKSWEMSFFFFECKFEFFIEVTKCATGVLWTS